MYIKNNLPILLSDQKMINKMLKTSKMSEEYENIRQDQNKKNNLNPLLKSIKMIKNYVTNFLMDDLRTQASKKALDFFDKFDEKTLNLAIGGGPKIHHRCLTNLNIAPFVNVDVVADAHKLPYVNNCVDSIYCEAVLEHLYNPNLAVQEMSRAMKKGGLVYCCTPFMQAYHGYPHHYQNLTLTGQQNLFESNGFEIHEAGTCVGPTMSLIILNYYYCKRYLPKIFLPFAVMYALLGLLLLKRLDIIISPRENSYLMASTTYVIARKL
ncbi:MAG: class I SAM-dependent methyltransferase [Patescibacteria group bacterium]|jgi:SAM-dependent methyltransferase